MSSASSAERYLPAAGRIAPVEWYDGVVKLTMREAAWRPLLVRQLLAAVPVGGRVVEVGAGTGAISLALAAARPDVEVVSFDADADVLRLARAKPGAERVEWRLGRAGDLTLPDASADAVVMSLLLHHLAPDDKHRAVRDARRVLRGGGVLHVADWGRPATPALRVGFLALQLLDGFDNTRDHAAGRLPEVLRDAGLVGVRRYRRLRTVWGSLELLAGRAPGDLTAAGAGT